MKNEMAAAFLILGLLACQTGKEQQRKGVDDLAKPILAASMQNLKLTLEKVMPKAIDSKAFNDPANRGQLKTDLAILNDIASRVSHAPVKEKMDPSFTFLSEGFSSEIARANEAFAIHRIEYARYKILNVTSYCIECHTRMAYGPSFAKEDLSGQLAGLPVFEKGEYYLATRQFDAALGEFLKLFKVEEDRYQYIQFDRAIRYALAITVRFQNDPDKTQMVIEKMQTSRQLPHYLKQASQAWQQDVKYWKAELKKKRGEESLSQKLKAAESLIERGRLQQSTINERSGDVVLLRALSLLHQVLTQPLEQADLGKALFLTGTGYEAVRDVVTWSLQESYFESCIRRVPHSKWSMSCYKSLEETLVNGFTGSSGTRLPYDVQVRLAELEKLAGPEVPGQSR